MRVDIVFMVFRFVRFNLNPEILYYSAVNQVIRYLLEIKDYVFNLKGNNYFEVENHAFFINNMLNRKSF